MKFDVCIKEPEDTLPAKWLDYGLNTISSSHTLRYMYILGTLHHTFEFS